jgi:hypothetical protein
VANASSEDIFSVFKHNQVLLLLLIYLLYIRYVALMQLNVVNKFQIQHIGIVQLNIQIVFMLKVYVHLIKILVEFYHKTLILLMLEEFKMFKLLT